MCKRHPRQNDGSIPSTSIVHRHTLQLTNGPFRPSKDWAKDSGCLHSLVFCGFCESIRLAQSGWPGQATRKGPLDHGRELDGSSGSAKYSVPQIQRRKRTRSKKHGGKSKLAYLSGCSSRSKTHPGSLGRWARLLYGAPCAGLQHLKRPITSSGFPP